MLSRFYLSLAVTVSVHQHLHQIFSGWFIIYGYNFPSSSYWSSQWQSSHYSVVFINLTSLSGHYMCMVILVLWATPIIILLRSSGSRMGPSSTRTMSWSFGFGHQQWLWKTGAPSFHLLWYQWGSCQQRNSGSKQTRLSHRWLLGTATGLDKFGKHVLVFVLVFSLGLSLGLICMAPFLPNCGTKVKTFSGVPFLPMTNMVTF